LAAGFNRQHTADQVDNEFRSDIPALVSCPPRASTRGRAVHRAPIVACPGPLVDSSAAKD